jgi:hypothetical protein
MFCFSYLKVNGTGILREEAEGQLYHVELLQIVLDTEAADWPAALARF